MCDETTSHTQLGCGFALGQHFSPSPYPDAPNMQKGFSSSFGTDVVRDLENKLARNLVVVVVLAAGGVALSTVEVYWLWAHGGESDAACEFLKLLSSFFTLWLIGFLFLYYRRTFELMKETNSLLRQDTLASSGLILSTQRWSFVPEALAYLVHPLPFVCVELSVPYYDLKRGQGYTTTVNSDELACLFMMAARALLLVRCAPYVAGFAGRQSRMYANLNHLDLSTGLALRLTFLRAPARLLGAVTVVLLAVAGFALQLSERRVNHDLDDYANCFWLAVVSMTGIGFGELYPQTPIGEGSERGGLRVGRAALRAHHPHAHEQHSPHRGGVAREQDDRARAQPREHQAAGARRISRLRGRPTSSGCSARSP